MSADAIRYGSSARAGTYRCADCGHTMKVGALSSMPPCPRASDVEHEAHAWRRQGHGALWLVIGGIAVGALVYAVGTRRLAEEARELAEELSDQGRRLSDEVAAQGRRLSGELSERGRRLSERGLSEAEHGMRRLRRTVRSRLG